MGSSGRFVIAALLVAVAVASDASTGFGAEPRVAGAAPAYLPDAGCAAVESSLDDASNAFHPADSSVVKIIYAFAADAPDRFAATYPQLAQAVRDMEEYVYLESGDRRSIRFDLGTASGPDCV